jgi:hypothetical protein
MISAQNTLKNIFLSFERPFSASKRGDENKGHTTKQHQRVRPEDGGPIGRREHHVLGGLAILAPVKNTAASLNVILFYIRLFLMGH